MRKFNFLTVLIMNKTYSIRAPNTKRMQANIQASMAVSPSALGVLVVTVLKMLTSTRNKVTRRAIRPGITSMGMRNDIQDTMTKRPRKERLSKGQNSRNTERWVVNLSPVLPEGR